MKRILLLDHAQAIGGAEICLQQLIGHLDQGTWQPVLGGKPGLFMQSIKTPGVEQIDFSFPAIRKPITFFPAVFEGVHEIVRFCKQNNIDLIHANTIRAAVYGALAAKWARIPFVWHMHDFWLSESRPKFIILDRFIKRLIGAAAAKIIVNSNALKNHLPASRKNIVVHNGIETSFFSHTSETKPDWQPYASNEGCWIGTVGRLRPIKGQDRFLRIAARIAQKNTAVRFIIVGGDNFEVADLYANEVKQLPKTLGIEDLVTFTGHLDDVRPALAGMDIFVNPGDPETFGLVNLEAMAMGIPVVAFDHAALPEIVEHGVSGLLVPSGNEHMLEAAITRLIEQPALATEMGRAGRTRVEQFFTAERMAAEIQGIWEEVLG